MSEEKEKQPLHYYAEAVERLANRLKTPGQDISMHSIDLLKEHESGYGIVVKATIVVKPGKSNT